jgi:hypothetical protein
MIHDYYAGMPPLQLRPAPTRKRARESLIGSAEHYAQALKAFASQVRSRMWIEQGRLSHKRWLRVTSRELNCTRDVC